MKATPTPYFHLVSGKRERLLNKEEEIGEWSVQQQTEIQSSDFNSTNIY